MAWVNIMDLVYPVGSIYLSQNSTSPASIFGGTWAAIDGGKALRANAEWSEAGADTINLNHNHTTPIGFDRGSKVIYLGYTPNDYSGTWSFKTHSGFLGSASNVGLSYTTNDQPGRWYGTDKKLSTTQSIVQKSQNIYAWYRTA